MSGLIVLAMMSLFGPDEIENTNAVPERVYTKLAYAADTPATRPADRVSPLVFIDPGHGGKKNHGCRGYDGRFESEANLLLALAVRDELIKADVEAMMTREDDSDVPLYERPRRAHELKADAFVSIHHNAPAAGKDPLAVRYRAVYSWNDLGQRLAVAIAARLAPCDSLHANFAVTRSPEIPSVLVEADFLTHPDGCREAFDPERRAQIARAIAQGILDWLAANR